jgi:hypothetical protein
MNFLKSFYSIDLAMSLEMRLELLYVHTLRSLGVKLNEIHVVLIGREGTYRAYLP